MNAAQARQTSGLNRSRILTTKRRNVITKRRAEAKALVQQRAERAEDVQKDYKTGLAKAIRSGHHSFKVEINTIYDNDLSVRDFLVQEEDAPALRKIWRSLRARKFKVQIFKKSKWHDGKSYYEGISDRDPWWAYSYTAKVSW